MGIPEYLTTGEAARRLGLSREMVRHLALVSKLLPLAAKASGGVMLFWARDVERLRRERMGRPKLGRPAGRRK